RYGDEILRPIVVPFIHDHHHMLQHDNARPHVARICILYHPLSMFGMLWIGIYDSVFQFLPISSSFAHPLKRTNIPQATINNLINSMRKRCVALREANGGHTRY
ncbi:hypothetical protein M9458_002948, partial [Cirrhinus mrigala]